ncbi:MAG TPA: hypothetical protein VH916_12235, partial [Dehalococcoidia bacterium]
MAEQPATDPPPATASGLTPDVPARSGGRTRRWLPRLGVVALALGFAGLAWSCFAHGDHSTYSAPIARLAAASAGVTYLPRGHLYIVAQPDGSLLALDEALPSPPAGTNGCGVQWRPDVAGGIFQARPGCGEATFAHDGTAPTGGVPLLRHPVRLAGKNVVVDIRQ